MSGATAWNPAAASAASWWRQEYQDSGKPWQRMTSGPVPCSATCMRMPFVSTARCVISCIVEFLPWLDRQHHYHRETMKRMTRRDVLRSMAGLGVLAWTGGAGTLFGGCGKVQSGAELLAADPEIGALVGSTVGIDMHSHAAGANARLKATYDLAERIPTGRMTAVCLGHPGDAPVIRRE